MQFIEENKLRLERLLTSFDQERETEYGDDRYLGPIDKLLCPKSRGCNLNEP